MRGEDCEVVKIMGDTIYHLWLNKMIWAWIGVVQFFLGVGIYLNSSYQWDRLGTQTWNNTVWRGDPWLRPQSNRRGSALQSINRSIQNADALRALPRLKTYKLTMGRIGWI
jgi:hypothetical protein